MSSEQPYRSVTVKEVHPYYRGKTRNGFGTVFGRLWTNTQFRKIKTSRGQVLLDKVLVEYEGDLAKEVPITELAKFFDLPHDKSVRAILVSL